MKTSLAGILLLASCAAQETPIGYQAPAETPYEASPRLKAQYLRAHQAAWNYAVGSVSEAELRKALEEGSGTPAGAVATCCEATRNVTLGWYRGLHDGQAFVATWTQTQDPPDRVVARFLRLKADLLDHPVKDWHVLNAYTPDLLVEVEEAGGARIRTFRDSTKSLLYSVREVKEGKNHGRCEEYDANGILEEVSTWVEGLREGPSISYADSGEVLGRRTYHLDREEGPALEYEDDGRLKSYAQYVRGRLEGLQIEWRPDGTLYYCNRFKNGRLEGRCLLFTEEGARVSVYENGVQVGATSDPLPVGDLPTEDRPATFQRLRERFRR